MGNGHTLGEAAGRECRHPDPCSDAAAPPQARGQAEARPRTCRTRLAHAPRQSLEHAQVGVPGGTRRLEPYGSAENWSQCRLHGRDDRRQPAPQQHDAAFGAQPLVLQGIFPSQTDAGEVVAPARPRARRCRRGGALRGAGGSRRKSFPCASSMQVHALGRADACALARRAQPLSWQTSLPNSTHRPQHYPARTGW